jgi:hypothetical protein
MKKVPTSVKLLFVMFALAVAVLVQSGPTCSVNTDSVPPQCPTSGGWQSGVTCMHRTISCPSVGGVTLNDLGITFGYKTPPGTVKGTIVFFSDLGGITPDNYPGGEKTFAGDYFVAGYQFVQTAWDSDWEDTGTATKNIAYAAGRVAAFLQWVDTNLYLPVRGLNGSAGMCVQGSSAGGAAAAYALAWYKAGLFVDKAEILSSPVLSDIQAGCEVFVGAYPIVEVCPPGQLGCNPNNSPSNWIQFPGYSNALSYVRTWTGDSSGDSGTCQRSGGNTSSAANAAWKAMSIVDGTVGTFNYPNTNITSWLCSSVQSQDGLNDGVMNNSSPEAQLFFQNFTSSSQTQGLTINGVTGCVGIRRDAPA